MGESYMDVNIPDLRTANALNFAKEMNNMQITEPCIFHADMDWVSPFGMLLTIATIKQVREKYKNIQFYFDNNNKGNGASYAAQMGFFKAISKMIGIGKEPGEAPGSGNYIPITELDLRQIYEDENHDSNHYAMGDAIENESYKLAKILGRDNIEMDKLLAYLLREILRNIPEHAKCSKAWVCGQYWGNGKNEAEISIVDEGIGIKESLRNNLIHRKYIDSDEDAIKYSIKAGISQTFNPDKANSSDDTWSNSGFGLYMVTEICKYLDGSFCLASGNKYLLFNRDIKEYFGDTSFHGTAIKIRISTLKINNSKELIEKIAEQGEIQARSIRNAFKKASVPSKGLIDNM